MDDLTCLRIVFWLMVAGAWFSIGASRLHRRRLKKQHEMFVAIYVKTAADRMKEVDFWKAKANDASLPVDERLLAHGFAVGAVGSSLAYADVAADIEHVLVNGKTFDSRRAIMTDETSCDIAAETTP